MHNFPQITTKQVMIKHFNHQFKTD